MRLIRLWLSLGLLSAAAMAATGHGKLLGTMSFRAVGAASRMPRSGPYDLGGGGWGNHELETYTEGTKNAFLDGKGHLVIRAEKDAAGRFSSARMKTQGKFAFTYGRAAARMKLPRGQGMWPAFWMLGADIEKVHWPGCGEVDVMESLGREPSTVHGTVHGPGYSGAHGISAKYVLPGTPKLADKFHVYAVDWRPGSLAFSIDRHVYATVTPASLPHGAKWVYDHPFFLLVNLAVGGAWPGNPDALTVFPQELVVDWVRVYRNSHSSGTVDSPSR